MKVLKTLVSEHLETEVNKMKFTFLDDNPLPGQMCIFDYPEYCPESTKKEGSVCL